MAFSSGKRVLIDTNVLIFCLLKDMPITEEMSSKAKYSLMQSHNAKNLLSRCRKENAEVFVSSVSISETLEFLPDEEAREMFNLMGKFFAFLSFDANAAFMAARLAAALHTMDVQNKPEKSKVRNDLYILATGLQNNCTDFYSTDKVLLKQASRLAIPMAVHELSST